VQPEARRHTRSYGRPALAALLGTALLGAVLCACSSAGTAAHRARSATTTTKASASTTPSAPGAQTAWTTYGGSFLRTSVDTDDPAVSQAPKPAWTSAAPDGAIYGEPLVYSGGVFVATENDTVYGYSASTGAPLWPADHLATPAPAGALPCGDITPTVGITSTMVIDPSTGVLFASAETGSAGAVEHFLFAIDTSTGKVLWSRDLDQPGWTASAQLQRAGLALSGGDVLAGFGGNYGDCGDYSGWVVGVPESGSGRVIDYRVPTAREGAIWAPAGITVEQTGDVFVATGNGSAVSGQPFDHGDAVIELSPQLSELQYFAPSNWTQLNEDDGDLGSTSPIDLGNGELFEVGKGGTGYLLDAGALGRIGGQVSSLSLCFSIGGGAYLAPDVYVVCNQQGSIAQVTVGQGGKLNRGWTWKSPTGGASSPTIAGGVLWSVDPGSSTLYGVYLANGTTLYSLPLHTGALAHFVAASAADRMLLVAGAGGVEAFDL